jgi:hypothetical protein
VVVEPLGGVAVEFRRDDVGAFRPHPREVQGVVSHREVRGDDDVEYGDRLEQLEHQLVKLGDHTDGVVERQLSVARDNLDRFRQERAPGWEYGSD